MTPCITYKQACELAEAWVRIITEDRGVVIKEDTEKRPYGWIFSFQSRKYLASGKFEDQMVGNTPILVDRVMCEIRTYGSGEPRESFLARYEAGLPPVWKFWDMPEEP